MTISISLDSSQRQALQEGYDSMIAFYGKVCKLIYQPLIVEAGTSTQLADNTYIQGNYWMSGPMRVDQQGVPMAGGQNMKTQESSENITMTIDWYPKDYLNSNITNIAPIEFNFIKTRGKIVDLPKIQKCIEMHVQIPLNNYIIGRYRLKSGATDAFSIIQEKYFIASWERII